MWWLNTVIISIEILRASSPIILIEIIFRHLTVRKVSFSTPIHEILVIMVYSTHWWRCVKLIVCHIRTKTLIN
jgi:hypothetical protein